MTSPLKSPGACPPSGAQVGLIGLGLMGTALTERLLERMAGAWAASDWALLTSRPRGDTATTGRGWRATWPSWRNKDSVLRTSDML